MYSDIPNEIVPWGLRPGLPVGCKVTIRREPAMKLIPRLLAAKGYELEESNFDPHGTISFGISEYIDIEGVDYDPEIGIIGLQVCITLEKQGYRIKRRKLMKRRIPQHHQVDQETSINYMRNQFHVKLRGAE
jgi:large subunit ribosomal protein L5